MTSKTISNIELESILDFLRRENRPYTSIMLYENMKRILPKPQIVKGLEILTNDGKIICKEFGKAKVYLINQNTLPNNTEEILRQVKELEEKVNNVKEKLLDLKNKNNILSSHSLNVEELVRINNELSSIKLKIVEIAREENIKIDIKNIESSENNEIYDQIGRIKSVHEKTHLGYEINIEWYKRKKFCEKIIKTISGVIEIGSLELINDMGIEDDPYE